MKKSKRQEAGDELNITSMMDLMTIILVFLLKSYSTTDISIAPEGNLEIPFSTAAKAPELAVNLVVSQVGIIVDGRPILALTKEEDENNPGIQQIALPEEEVQGPLIPKLADILTRKAEDAKDLASKTQSDEHAFKGRILIQCDKSVPFKVLRQVMYTAGQAQFGEFKFVIYKKE
ncbi:MAG: biopolymer transporter ExbD [Myxococcota bacterium]|nr:biopolymer transporter ExbD [Myxococcota bacterium]